MLEHRWHSSCCAGIGGREGCWSTGGTLPEARNLSNWLLLAPICGDLASAARGSRNYHSPISGPIPKNYDADKMPRPRHCFVCLAHNASNVQAHLCRGRFKIDKHGCDHHGSDVDN